MPIPASTCCGFAFSASRSANTSVEAFLVGWNCSFVNSKRDKHCKIGVLTPCCLIGIAVSSVSNGMQAWEMLEDPNNHFDLVLTDVVMPCLSGVGLLTKIMSNESAKRIPVISKLLALQHLLIETSVC